MFGLHEMPREGRRLVIRNAMRIARQSVILVDIWPGFEPTAMMLSGEPYIKDYLSNVEEDVDATAELGDGTPDEWIVRRVDVVDEHVRMWRLERKSYWGI